MEEKDELIHTVYTIKHSDIPKGRTQCTEHQWKPLNEKEMHCSICDSVIIVKDL